MMARPKRETEALHIRMDADLMRRLNEYCEHVGQTKTTAVGRIVEAFLDTQKAKGESTSTTEF